MTHSKHSDDTLNRLLDDVLSSDDVTPEQLVQYAEQPESLDDDERAFIEQRLDESPALADQLRVLNDFRPAADPASASAPVTQAGGGLLQKILDSLDSWFSRPLLPMAALALVVAVTAAVLLRIDEPTGVTPQMAVDEPPVDDTRVPQETRPDTPRQQPQLADNQTPPEPSLNIADEKRAPQVTQTTTEKAPPDTLMLAMIDPEYVSPYGTATQVIVRGDTPAVEVLAPQKANTLSPQPVLYWWLHDIKPGAELLLDISDDRSGDILLSKPLAMPNSTGLQKINLRDLGLKLEANRTYQWSLILSPDKNNPSLDQFAGAAIRHVKADAELAAQLADSTDASRVNLYARNGYWYEALHEILRLRAAHADNASIEQAYRSLLQQANIELDK